MRLDYHQESHGGRCIMSSFEEVDLDELEKEVAQAALSKPKRKAKVDTSERTTVSWFRLPHTYGECENEDCEDPRPSKVPGFKTAMLADVGSMKICRFCFLAGYGKEEEATDG